MLPITVKTNRQRIQTKQQEQNNQNKYKANIHYNLSANQ